MSILNIDKNNLIYIITSYAIYIYSQMDWHLI